MARDVLHPRSMMHHHRPAALPVDEYHFGPFRLDLRARELHRDGELLHVEPKVFNLIAYLVSRREHVVSHRELLDHIWVGETVCLAAVTQCVAQARRTLGDSAQDPKYIRTSYRRGYRFIADARDVHRTVPPIPFPVPAALMSAASA